MTKQDEQELISEAIRRGFLNASKIIPAHMLAGPITPVLIIPSDAFMNVSSYGDVTFKVEPSKTSFPEEDKPSKWEGVIYYNREKSWAKIIQSRTVSLVGRYIKVLRKNLGGFTGKYSTGDYLKILQDPKPGYTCHRVEYVSTLHIKDRVEQGDISLMPEGWYPGIFEDKLSEFPSQGICWDYTDELIAYLKKIKPYSTTWSCNSSYKGIAWNSDSVWGVANSSGKPEYTMKQLERFIPKTNYHLQERPLTPEEAYVPFSVRNDFRLPDKWCIKVTRENKIFVGDFLAKRKDEFVGYQVNWVPLANNFYFNYPQEKDCVKQSSEVRPGYTEITFEQFKKHVLTHTMENDEPFSFRDNYQLKTINLKLKEDGKSTAFKVQRPNLTIRESDPIRATGLRCPKVQIKIGSELSSDTFRSRRS